MKVAATARVYDTGSPRHLDDGQLFDLNADPEETENLWDDPDHQDVKRDLLDTLLEWRIRSDVATADWAEDFR